MCTTCTLGRKCRKFTNQVVVIFFSAHTAHFQFLHILNHTEMYFLGCSEPRWDVPFQAVLNLTEICHFHVVLIFSWVSHFQALLNHSASFQGGKSHAENSI